MSVENAHAEHFVERMFGAESVNTYQTFHDSVKGQPGQVIHGTYAQAEPALLAAQQAGHGVFITVNQTDGLGRGKEHITRVRCVWLDRDEVGHDLGPVTSACMPHAVVESSPGKHHIYWKVDCSLEQFDALLDAITPRWGGDVGAKGVNRVLRLPGYLHLKGEPSVSRIVPEFWRPDMASYTVAQLTAALLAGAAEPGVVPPAAVNAAWSESSVEGWANARTDEQVQEKLADPSYRIGAAQMFGDKETLHDLWNGDVDRFKADGSRSEARMSLLSQLMMLCGGNCEQVYRFANGHPLATKDGREALLRAEILKAHAGFLAWWLPQKARRDAQRAETQRIGEAVGESIMPTILTLDEMRARLVYVAAASEVADRISGRTRSWDAARGEYAGSRHKYADPDGKEHDVAGLSLWRADPTRMTVDVLTWAPGQGEFCAPPETVSGNSRAFNTWRGLKVMPAPANWAEWAGSFERHVAYLIPDAAQRTRFMQWLAHIVMKPGELPHTCYLMIAKETGIGRNWLAAVLARVMPGHVAAGVSLAPILDGKFNGRLSQNCLPPSMRPAKA